MLLNSKCLDMLELNNESGLIRSKISSIDFACNVSSELKRAVLTDLVSSALTLLFLFSTLLSTQTTHTTAYLSCCSAVSG